MKIKREVLMDLKITQDIEDALMNCPKDIAERWIREQYLNRYIELASDFQYWEPIVYKNMKEKRAMGLAK